MRSNKTKTRSTNKIIYINKQKLPVDKVASIFCKFAISGSKNSMLGSSDFVETGLLVFKAELGLTGGGLMPTSTTGGGD